MEENAPTPLITILGPTASGKTRVAVAVAQHLNGAIISADSRQVYRGMNLGTGKDLGEYGNIPYRLIDIREAGETYHVAHYRADFHRALQAIRAQGKQPILCGGTGLYIHSVLQQGFDYSAVPIDSSLRTALEPLAIEILREQLSQLPLPTDFTADTSTKKRLIRAIEIGIWCRHHSLPPSPYPPVRAVIFGINPPVETRRQRITERLQLRLEQGLVQEVSGLLETGIPPEKLLYYGLEYKYVTQYLLGVLDYPTFFARLNAEIHRFAKRQMTYFRKLEKDGLKIHWLVEGTVDEMAAGIIGTLRAHP